MPTNLDYDVRLFERGDEDEVIELVTDAFDALNRDLWLWKYLENPRFDESLVLVAENQGKVIGCMHYLPREFKIGRSFRVKGALGADFAVHRDYRLRGIGSSILRFSRSSRILEKKGIILTYGFIDARRADLYRRNIDSIIIPLSTSTYSKFFDISRVEKRFVFLDKLTEMGNELPAGLRDANFSVVFRLRGNLSFTFKVENGKINVEKAEIPHPDITVEGDPYLLESVYDGSKGILHLITGILNGKIRIRGSVRKILYFYRTVKMIKRLSPQEG